jgi:hypothetical protein
MTSKQSQYIKDVIRASALVRRIITTVLVVGFVLLLASSAAGWLTALSLRGAANRADRSARRAGSALRLAEANEGRIARDERFLCHRLNVHRVIQDDANAYREWLFDRLFLQLVEHPIRSQTPQSSAQREATKVFVTYLTRVVNGMTWTPATRSCLSPGAGQRPIRFVDRVPTPRDLTLGSGE